MAQAASLFTYLAAQFGGSAVWTAVRLFLSASVILVQEEKENAGGILVSNTAFLTFLLIV